MNVAVLLTASLFIGEGTTIHTVIDAHGSPHGVANELLQVAQREVSAGAIVRRAVRNRANAKAKGDFIGNEFMDPTVVMELRCFHCIMTAANWDYMISEGTLLAAARNGFLLPWDSDGDVVFDAHGGSYDSFYRLFTPGPMSNASMQCPAECRALQMSISVGPFEIDGVQMHYWQGYEDMVSGNPVELNSDKKRKAPAETHKWLLDKIQKPTNDRLYRDGSWSARNHPSYLDVAPYSASIADVGGPHMLIGGDPPCMVGAESVMPINRHCAVKNFGKGGVEAFELACPSRPEAYLDAYFGNDWSKEPYNKWDEDASRWVYDPYGGSLEQFLRTRHNYTGPLEAACSGHDGGRRRVLIFSFGFVCCSFLAVCFWAGWVPQLVNKRATAVPWSADVRAECPNQRKC